MLPWVQQEALHLENTQNLIRAISKNWDSAMPLDAQLMDRFFIGPSIRNRKCVDARRHAVLHCLVTQADNFGDHFSLVRAQMALFCADLDQHDQLLIVQLLAGLRFARKQEIRNAFGKALEFPRKWS